VRHVGYLQEMNRDARSTEHKIEQNINFNFGVPFPVGHRFSSVHDIISSSSSFGNYPPRSSVSVYCTFLSCCFIIQTYE